MKAPMLDSSGMANPSEGDGRQGTLAGLWLEPTRKRASEPAPPQSQEPRTTSLEPAVAPTFAPWSVRNLVNDLRQHVESAYADLWVEGEVSNCRAASSGHIYFTLKDGEAQLPVVLFRRQAQLLGFQPQDGLAILVRGRVSVYESRGQLQLIADTLQLRGAGALQLAYEQLKARLLAEGLFDAGRKRALPAFPRTVGVITSTSGAVLHDIVKIVRRRHARLNLVVYPATVQGPDCASSVAAGIRWFNHGQSNQDQRKRGHPDHRPGNVDLIVIARGGGSLEDLAGFNDESLARAIAASALPVVAAIGHETDFTIADFVADLRAPTPSAAAELITAAQHGIQERISLLTARVHRAMRYQLMLAMQRFTALSVVQIQNSLLALIGRRSQRLDDLRHRLALVAHRGLRERSSKVAVLQARLQRRNPSIRLALARRRLEVASQSLSRLAHAALAARRTRLDRAAARLDALSPLAVLNRGYALIYLEGGTGARQLLRNATDAHPGQTIRARLADGSVTAEVRSTQSA